MSPHGADRSGHTSSGRSPLPACRLIVVCRVDPAGRYDWIPPPRGDDLTIALDGIAHRDLTSRRSLLFDELESWEERSAAEHRIAQLMVAIREHPAVGAIGGDGYPLIDFAEPRLRVEIARLLRGWRIACAAGAGAGEPICDPAAPPALLMGIRAGLGLDPSAVGYVLPPALPGSRRKRAVARSLMRALAAGSRPQRVRVAAVVAGKLSLALAALTADELHALGVGAMPFPGIDHGNSALLALRRRLPLLATSGSSRAGTPPAVRLPARLDLDEVAEIDRALTLLVGRLMSGAACEFAQAIGALAGLERARSLRALVLPNTGFGASRLLMRWAHERGLRVASLQHGIYTLRDVDEGERMADVVFGWGEGAVEQARCWRSPRTPVVPVGVPGVVPPPKGIGADLPPASLSRVLIATSNITDMPLAPVATCETFIEVIAPALKRLTAAGVELRLRPHPNEDLERYRRLLDAHELEVRIASGGPLSAATVGVDIMISSVSSVAFEAAGLGLPVLLWLGGAPRWVRREHMVPPWAEDVPGMFAGAEELMALTDGLLRRPEQAFAVARELASRLARFAEPFQRERFAEGLRSLTL